MEKSGSRLVAGQLDQTFGYERVGNLFSLEYLFVLDFILSSLLPSFCKHLIYVLSFTLSHRTLSLAK